jgi:sulfonate transport system substrate-binding protein
LAGLALAKEAPLPGAVPGGTELTIAGPDRQLQLQLAGLADTLPFKVSQWPNVTTGPDVINAFRARSLDVASNAGIPPIQAYSQGDLDARIVAVRLTRKPAYVFVTKPRSDVQTVADFRGKQVAFSQGQAQGVVLLRALKLAGLQRTEVTLVELNSAQFLTALQAGQVDVAPLSITVATQYLGQYARDGARQITTNVVDLLNILWSPDAVLADPTKAAAIAAYVPIWAQGLVWAHEHPDAWIREWYVSNQGVSEAQAKEIIAATSPPLFPPNWDEAIAWEQETVDLLAEEGFVASFDAEALFDRRFESLAANAVAARYRS